VAEVARAARVLALRLDLLDREQPGAARAEQAPLEQALWEQASAQQAQGVPQSAVARRRDKLAADRRPELWAAVHPPPRTLRGTARLARVIPV
jgi:hypothetical protein